MSFIVQNGSYKIDAPCPGCGATDGWSCYPGKFPECWRCGVKVLKFGRTPEAKCVCPNGRIDSHMTYVRMVKDKGVCAFCGKSK